MPLVGNVVAPSKLACDEMRAEAHERMQVLQSYLKLLRICPVHMKFDNFQEICLQNVRIAQA